MPTRSPRPRCGPARPASTSSSPSSRPEPESAALGELVRPTIVCAATLLPAPDSPTIATTSPAPSSNETPSTACSTPRSVLNETFRSATESRGTVPVAGLAIGALPEPHARVELRVGDVDQRVEDDDEEGAEQGHGHQRRQAEPFHGFRRILADPVQAEQLLGEDRAAADHGAEVEAEEGDDRDQRVAQDVG